LLRQTSHLLWGRRSLCARRRFVLSHPWHKNKRVPRMGHPNLISGPEGFCFPVSEARPRAPTCHLRWGGRSLCARRRFVLSHPFRDDAAERMGHGAGLLEREGFQDSGRSGSHGSGGSSSRRSARLSCSSSWRRFSRSSRSSRPSLMVFAPWLQSKKVLCGRASAVCRTAGAAIHWR